MADKTQRLINSDIPQPTFAEEVLTFIREHVQAFGYAPTTREMAEGCTISLDSAHKSVDWLEMHGYVVRRYIGGRRVARGLQVCDPPLERDESAGNWQKTMEARLRARKAAKTKKQDSDEEGNA